MNKSMQIAVSLLVASAVLLSGCAKKASATGTSEYVFSTVEKGAIEKTVSSSETLEPVSTVSVVAQMSGIVERVYADYNDCVAKGDTLAELNTDMLELQMESQKSAVAKAQANYDLQLVSYNNQLKLSEKGLISEYEIKSSKTTLDVNAAELSSAKASLKIIETEISQYALVKSPLSGIILERDVDVGQSVVEGSSSNSQSLFTIAENLTQMKIEATVDEIDIASIKKGQSVRFTVEAIDDATYTGEVSEIHLVPQTSNNVVSYTVIIAFDNSGETLLPGMTAEVEFIVSNSEDALLVPNAALRYSPTTLTAEEIASMVKAASLAGLTDEEKSAALASEQPASDGSDSAVKQTGLASLVMGTAGGGAGGPGGPDSQKSSTKADDATAEAAVSKNVWYLDDSGNLAVAIVTTGVTDGSNTEIFGADDLEGKAIIVKEKVN
jgi:HlyD family secretion protein